MSELIRKDIIDTYDLLGGSSSDGEDPFLEGVDSGGVSVDISAEDAIGGSEEVVVESHCCVIDCVIRKSEVCEVRKLLSSYCLVEKCL